MLCTVAAPPHRSPAEGDTADPRRILTQRYQTDAPARGGPQIVTNEPLPDGVAIRIVAPEKGPPGDK